MSSPSLTLTPSGAGAVTGTLTPSLGEILSFSLSDTVGDILRGTVLFNAATPAYAPGPVLGTDLFFTVQLNSVTDTGLFDSALGLSSHLQSGQSINLGLQVNCVSGTTPVSCVQINDPSGPIIGAAVSIPGPTGASEPGTLVLSAGLLGLIFILNNGGLRRERIGSQRRQERAQAVVSR